MHPSLAFSYIFERELLPLSVIIRKLNDKDEKRNKYYL
jgi:hypothetical protein